jgi:hypothetical protein
MAIPRDWGVLTSLHEIRTKGEQKQKIISIFILVVRRRSTGVTWCQEVGWWECI